MGSLPQLSIVKGSYASLTPKFLHKVFEERVDQEGYGEKIAMIFKGNLNKFQHFLNNYFTFPFA